MVSSAIGRSAVPYAVTVPRCALLHGSCTSQEQAARLEAARERAELLGSAAGCAEHQGSRTEGTYSMSTMTLARQVAEVWREQGGREGAKHRQEVMAGADDIVMKQR